MLNMLFKWYKQISVMNGIVIGTSAIIFMFTGCIQNQEQEMGNQKYQINIDNGSGLPIDSIVAHTEYSGKKERIVFKPDEYTLEGTTVMVEFLVTKGEGAQNVSYDCYSFGYPIISREKGAEKSHINYHIIALLQDFQTEHVQRGIVDVADQERILDSLFTESILESPDSTSQGLRDEYLAAQSVDTAKFYADIVETQQEKTGESEIQEISEKLKLSDTELENYVEEHAAAVELNSSSQREDGMSIEDSESYQSSVLLNMDDTVSSSLLSSSSVLVILDSVQTNTESSSEMPLSSSSISEGVDHPMSSTISMSSSLKEGGGTNEIVSSSASVDSVLIVAWQDATVRGPADQTRSGSKDNYSIGSMPRMGVGVYDEYSVDRSLVQFKIPDGIVSSEIENAVFRISILSWGNHIKSDDITIRIHRVLRSWNEGSSIADQITTASINGVTGAERFWGTQNGDEDWNLPGVGLDDVDAVALPETELVVPSESTGFIEFDITELVKFWIEHPYENRGFILANVFTIGNSQHKYPIFHSSEADVLDTEKPRLLVRFK